MKITLITVGKIKEKYLKGCHRRIFQASEQIL